MTASDPRVGEIQARPVAFHKLNRSQLLTLAIALEDQRDKAFAELRDRDEKLAKVSRIVNSPDWEGFPPFRVDAEPIRAAVAAAGGGGDA